MRQSVPIDAVVAQRVQDAAIRRSTGLLIWTVYERPRDYPSLFIARPHLSEPGQTQPLPFHRQAYSLEALREMLPVGLTMLVRAPEDDPAIVEVWLRILHCGNALSGRLAAAALKKSGSKVALAGGFQGA